MHRRRDYAFGHAEALALKPGAAGKMRVENQEERVGLRRGLIDVLRRARTRRAHETMERGADRRRNRRLLPIHPAIGSGADGKIAWPEVAVGMFGTEIADDDIGFPQDEIAVL